MKPTTRARLARYHRWTALTLLPVYVTLLLSGAVLALHPMLHPRQKEPVASPLDTARFGALLRQVDASGKVDGVGVDPDGHTLTLFDRGAARTHDLITGAERPAPLPQSEERDIWDIVRQIHVRLWIGAGFLVTLATFGMFFLVVVGPILSRPRRTSRTLLNWHINTGWLLYPVLIIVPLSAMMMVLPIGRRFHLPGKAEPITISRAFDIARDSVDMARLRFINRMPNGAAFLVTEGRFGIARYVVTARSVDPLGGPAVELARRVHAGEWGGVWGGALDLAGALGLLAVLGSGTLSWWRRRRRALPNGVAAGDGRGGESLEAA